MSIPEIGYFGSPEISASVLKTIISENLAKVKFVVTNPDAPKGRSGTPQPTPVHITALEAGIPVYTPAKLKDPAFQETLRQYGAELYFVFAYGRILPESVFRIPAGGSVNLHASFLPLLRGASPIQSSLIEGFTETGWTIQVMEMELDSGDILKVSEPVPIEITDTAAELTEKLMPAAAEVTRSFFKAWSEGSLVRIKQDTEKVTHCSKITPEMAVIDWKKNALSVHNFIRGLNPGPVARTTLNGKLIKIYRTLPVSGTSAELELPGLKPGQLLVSGSKKNRKLLAGCSDFPLEITELQPEGKKIQNAADFINGWRFTGNEEFGS